MIKKILILLLFITCGVAFGGNAIQLSGSPYNPIPVKKRIYIGQVSGNKVFIIDTIENKLVKTLEVGSSSQTHFITHGAVVGNKLYLNDFYRNTLAVINTDTEELETILDNSTGAGFNKPYYIATLNKKLFISNHNTGAGVLTVLDTRDNSFSQVSVGADPTYPLIIGTKVAVPSYNTDNFSLVDTKTNAVTTIGIGMISQYSAQWGDKLFITGPDSNAVVYNLITGSQSTISMINTNFLKVVGNDIYFIGSNPTGTCVRVIDGQTNAFIKDFSLTGDTSYGGVVFNGKLYFAHSTSNTIKVIDTTTRNIIGSISVGGGVTFITGVDGKIYVPNTSDGTMYVIDSATDTLIDVDNKPSLNNFSKF